MCESLQARNWSTELIFLRTHNPSYLVFREGNFNVTQRDIKSYMEKKSSQVKTLVLFAPMALSGKQLQLLKHMNKLQGNIIQYIKESTSLMT